jgi:hypothetical protein
MVAAPARFAIQPVAELGGGGRLLHFLLLLFPIVSGEPHAADMRLKWFVVLGA